MSIKTNLDQIWSEKEQWEKVIEARATLQNVKNVIGETDTKLQEIKDSGVFDTIPSDVKESLNNAWNAIKSTKAELENESEVIDWTPTK